MHRTRALAAAALLALAAAVPATAAPAAALPVPPSDTPTASGTAPEDAAGDRTPARRLFLTVSGAENTWIRGVVLRCAPRPTGPHPEAAEACAELEAVDGDLDRLPGDARPCTKQYDPVTVSATGAWHGHPTAWHRTFANACELTATTGPVFRF
ncbi:subtilase-type protease inhibitor [Streptomyces sp. C10-9-1]|uniref:SSI family serine proteinase inhibitor n=1 Tax=Streptomyces sp. C10-9-1 TaxID=1859285 RepID=UPI002110EC31|nr:SSI family serine proteinase inhibitor [Streptomyces sp. C10-9-1]MCQ6554875.1 subtilase-type protease inhibitor [Streptomyces sp. C10-9-1]